MCTICKDWQAGKLTTKEAFYNIGETYQSTEDEEKRRHLMELSDRILDKDVGQAGTDTELDKAWWDETHQ